MELYLIVNTKPPNKKQWVSTNPQTRKVWNTIFETITNFFCLSNEFRYENILYLLLIDTQQQIKLVGEQLRYLSPNMRSIASLIWKAYQKLDTETTSWIESTPGIYVNSISTEQLTDYIQSIPLLEINSTTTVNFQPKKLLLNFTDTQQVFATKVPTGFSTYSQALIYLLNIEIFPAFYSAVSYEIHE